VFNPEKLLWLNQQWIKREPLADLARHVEPLLEARGVRADPERLSKILPLLVERAKTLVEMADQLAPFFRSGVSFDEAAAKKNLTPETRPLLEEARRLVAEHIGSGAHALEAGFRELAAQKGLGLGKVAQPVRVAVTGSTVSPPLFETIVLLGRDESLLRIDAALSRIGG
jgi:glutamyl-tRNA synthetase